MTWEKQHEALGGSLVIDWDSLHGRFHGGPNDIGEKNSVSGNGHVPEKGIG